MPDDYDLLDETALRAAGGLKWTAFDGSIGAFVAEMDFGIADPVAQALQQAIARGRTGYPTPALSHALSDACAEWQATRHGWEVDPARIHAIGDVVGGLELVLAHFMPRGTPVVLPTPAYMPFKPLLELHGHPVIEVSHRLHDGAWRMDMQAIDDALGQGARMVILCNPHNPTGRVYDRDELLALSEVVERHGARVFADEIHAPLVFRGHRHLPYATVSTAAAAHAFIALSASKAWNLAGLKCAQLVFGNDADHARWQRISLLAGHGVSAMGMIASVAAWRKGGPWLARTLDYLHGNRDVLLETLATQLPGATCIAPQGTYLAWIDCRGLPSPVDRLPAGFFLRHARVALTEGRDCGEAGSGFARMNFAMPRPVLRQALARMGDAVRGQSEKCT